MNSALEAKYRRALRWYPRSWRLKYGDAMLGTLLEIADDDGRTTPTREELADLAVSGLQIRLSAHLSAKARELAATVALVTGLAFSVTYFLFHAWSPWASATEALNDPSYVGFGAFVNPGVLETALWLVACCCACSRLRRLFRASMMTIAALPIVLLLVERATHPNWFGPSTVTLVFFSALALMTFLGTPRPQMVPFGFAVALTGWMIEYVRIGALDRVDAHSLVSEQLLSQITVLSAEAAPIFSVALLTSAMLSLTGRRTAAQVILVSMVPWMVAYTVESVSISGPGLIGSVVLDVLTGGILLVVTAHVARLFGVRHDRAQVS